MGKCGSSGHCTSTNDHVPRPTVRIRIPEVADKSEAEFLPRVKPMIPGAYAVKPLRSGDVEPDRKTKDQMLNQKEVDPSTRLPC